MRIFILIYLWCIIFYASSTTANKEANHRKIFSRIVHDYVQNQGYPTQIISLLDCWDYNDLIVLSKTVTASIAFNHRNEYDFESVIDIKNKILFILDLNCAGSTNYIKQINERYLGHPYRWLILDNLEYDAELPENRLLSDLIALPDSCLTMVQKISDEEYRLIQFYRIDSNLKAIVEEFGTWNTSDGFKDLRTGRVISRRRRNLRQINLAAGFVIESHEALAKLTDSRKSLSFKEQKQIVLKDKLINSSTKINFNIMEYVFYAINATSTYRYTGTYGYRNKTTNQWNGLVNDVISNHVDTGGTAIFLTIDRIPIVDYIAMSFPANIKFIFRAPPLSYVANIYTLPFDTMVWISTGVFLIISVVTIFLIHKVYYSIDNGDSEKSSVILSDTVLLGIAAACQMDMSVKLRTVSGKIAVLTLFLATMFVFTSYTANIVALLQAQSTNIKTLKDLADSKLEIGVDDNVYNHYYFKTASDPVRKRLYETKVAPNNVFINMTDGVARVKQGLFAFHLDLGPGYKIVENTFYEHEKCGLTEIQFIQSGNVWMVTRKNSPYREIFKTNLLRMHEFGLQKREFSKFYLGKPKCVVKGQIFSSIRLTDCYFLLLILIYGFIFSFLFFVCEIMIHQIRSKKLNVGNCMGK